jgi:uncharacterized small protein (DUF1192 family)
MEIDDLPRKKADLLKAVETEDLDRYSVAELDERMARLEAELARTRTRRAATSSVRSAADALFKR